MRILFYFFNLVYLQQEYDLDEQDMAWLELTNQDRKNKFSLPDIEPDELEFLIDRIEKESYFEQSKMSNSQNNYQVCFIYLLIWLPKLPKHILLSLLNIFLLP